MVGEIFTVLKHLTQLHYHVVHMVGKFFEIWILKMPKTCIDNKKVVHGKKEGFYDFYDNITYFMLFMKNMKFYDFMTNRTPTCIL